MVAIVGFITLILIIVSILFFRASPVPVFIAIPVISALILGVSPLELGKYIEEGILQVMSVGTLFIFAMLYFGIMSDAGLFDPITDKLKNMAGNNVILITVATALIAMVSHLDGTGASTFLVSIPAMLPIYRKLNLNPLILLLIVVMSAGVMNMLPWGGPFARVAVVLDVDPSDLWVPLIPIQIIGLIIVLIISFYLGVKEKKRLKTNKETDLAVSHIETAATEEEVVEDEEKYKLKRPKLWGFNLVLTIGTLSVLIFTDITISSVFMVVFAITIFVNYPHGNIQMERIRAHAGEAFTLVTILLAAGAFLGIISGSGMVDEMTVGLVHIIPNTFGSYVHIIAGIVSVPLLMILPADAYFFAYVPLLMEIGAEHGVSATSVAYAAGVGATIAGYISPLIAATYLAVGLARVDIASHIRFSVIWIWSLSIILLIACILLGLVTI